MPIYEYQCKKCEHQLEVLQSINEAPLEKCPECGKFTLTKLISASGFQLKGTGWYVTDFKNKDQKPTSSAAKESSATEKTTATPAKTEEK